MIKEPSQIDYRSINDVDFQRQVRFYGDIVNGKVWFEETPLGVLPNWNDVDAPEYGYSGLWGILADTGLTLTEFEQIDAEEFAHEQAIDYHEEYEHIWAMRGVQR